MELNEFIEKWHKMCRFHTSEGTCQKTCKFHTVFGVNRDCIPVHRMDENDVRKAELLLEEFEREHPPKTMAQDFFEKFPNAPKHNGGEIPIVCPYYCGYTDESTCLGNIDCVSCWNRPLEE